MKTIIKIVTVLFIFFNFISCSKHAKPNELYDFKNIQIETSKTKSKQSYNEKTIKGINKNLSIEITFPLFDNQVDSLIEKNICGKYNTFSNLIAYYNGKYNDRLQKNQNYQHIWKIDYQYNITFNNNKFLCIQVSNNNYIGGSQPVYYIYYYIYNLMNNSVMTTNNIITDYVQFAELAEAEFKKIRNENSIAYFFPKDEKYCINDNIGLTKDSIIIYYNYYEIGSYADGPTILTLKKGIVTPYIYNFWN